MTLRQQVSQNSLQYFLSHFKDLFSSRDRQKENEPMEEVYLCHARKKINGEYYRTDDDLSLFVSWAAKWNSLASVSCTLVLRLHLYITPPSPDNKQINLDPNPPLHYLHNMLFPPNLREKKLPFSRRSEAEIRAGGLIMLGS